MATRKAPGTHEERKLLHERLLIFASLAVRTGTTKGLGRLIGEFDDIDFQNHLIFWIEKYTPIKKGVNTDNKHLWFLVPKGLREGYDLGGARLNPYYTIEKIKSDEHTEVKVSRLTAGTVQLTDKEFERKHIRLALEKFFIEGSIETRQRLFELITTYGSIGNHFRGSLFAQGGAPGLGRKK